MNAEQVVEKILSQARTQAEAIVNEAKDKAAAHTAELDAELAEYDRTTEDMAAAAAADKRQRMLAAARMNQGKQVLTAKVAVLDEVFAKAMDAVNRLPDDQYRSLMTALIKQAVETGDEEIIVGKNEKRIDTAFVKDINRQLGAGFKGNLRLSQERVDIPGGFILSRGKVRINASTGVLVNRLRETMQVDLVKELFE